MALPIPSLIALEVIEGLSSARRQRSFITVMRIKPVIDMTGKVGTAVEPWASPDENPTNKPIGPVIAVGRAVIWRVVKVPIWAHRCHSNVDGYLGWRRRCAA